MHSSPGLRESFSTLPELVTSVEPRFEGLLKMPTLRTAGTYSVSTIIYLIPCNLAAFESESHNGGQKLWKSIPLQTPVPLTILSVSKCVFPEEAFAMQATNREQWQLRRAA